MREILFRAKTKDTKWWVEGYYAIESNHACFANELKHTHFIFKDEFMDWGIGGLVQYEVIPETVGQYTGLTDKNGKKIFEGDILLIKTTLDSINKVTRDDEYIVKGVVVFNEGHFELDGEGLVLFTYWGVKVLFRAARFKEYEVIGNIHDNPELLKGEQK